MAPTPAVREVGDLLGRFGGAQKELGGALRDLLAACSKANAKSRGATPAAEYLLTPRLASRDATPEAEADATGLDRDTSMPSLCVDDLLELPPMTPLQHTGRLTLEYQLTPLTAGSCGSPCSLEDEYGGLASLVDAPPSLVPSHEAMTDTPTLGFKTVVRWSPELQTDIEPLTCCVDGDVCEDARRSFTASGVLEAAADDAGDAFPFSFDNCAWSPGVATETSPSVCDPSETSLDTPARVLMASSAFASAPPEQEAFSFAAAEVEWSIVRPVVSPSACDPIDTPLDTPTRVLHARSAFDFAEDHLESSFRLETVEWSSELQPVGSQAVCCPSKVLLDLVARMPQTGKLGFMPPPRLAADTGQFGYGGC